MQKADSLTRDRDHGAYASILPAVAARARHGRVGMSHSTARESARYALVGSIVAMLDMAQLEEEPDETAYAWLIASVVRIYADLSICAEPSD